MSLWAKLLKGGDSEELDRFFSLSLDLVCIADKEGVLRRLNRPWETTLGYPLEKLEGTSLVDLVHSNEAALTKTAIGDLAAGAPLVSFTNRCRRRDGDYRWIEWRAAPYKGKPGELIYATARDVTERMRAEESLLEQKKTLETVTSNMAQAMLIADGQLNVVSFNQKFELLFGFSPGEMRAGESTVALIRLWASRTQTSEAQLEKVLAALRQRKPSVSEFWQRVGDGPKTWIQIFHNPLQDGGFVRTYTDVTERKRAEEALLEQKKTLETVTSNMAQAMLIADGQLNVVSFNQKFELLFGFSPGEMRAGESTVALIRLWASRTRTSEAQLEKVLAALRQRTPSVSEFWQRVGDGPKTWIQIFHNPLQDGGFVRTYTDVTERKRAEEALRLSEEWHRLLAESAHDVIWTMDLSGRLTFVSPSIERLCGRTAEEAMRMGIEDLLAPESAALARQLLHRTSDAVGAGRRPESARLELEHRHANGGTVWTEVVASGMFDLAGGFVGLLGVTRDIPGRQKA